jgi:hypothetical protein
MTPHVTKLEATYKHLAGLHNITIEGDDSKKLVAHKHIQVARSEHFCGMFNTARSESTAVLKKPLPANIMEAVVDFRYKDDCGAVIKSKDLEFVSSVRVAADQFLIARLKEICGCHLWRVDNRKAALGLFNAAYEMSQNQSDPFFPRLGQMVIDYNPPHKKLSEEFVPHTRTLTHGHLSLAAVYPRGNLSADQRRAAQMRSLVSNPSQPLNTAHTDTRPCEYLSLETLEKWIVFGFMRCHTFLSHKVAMERWRLALNSSWTTVLYRDKVIYTHSYV